MMVRCVLARLVLAVLALVIAASAAQGATPATGFGLPDTPDPVECQVQPRSFEVVVALVGTPAADASPYAGLNPTPTVVGGPIQPGSGAPVAAGTEAAIVATVREYVACLNARDYARLLALLTDEFIRRNAAANPIRERDLALLRMPATPVAAAARMELQAVRDVRELEDGRLTAVVEVRRPDQEPEEATVGLIVFVLVGDRYLIDDLIYDFSQGSGTPTP